MTVISKKKTICRDALNIFINFVVVFFQIKNMNKLLIVLVGMIAAANAVSFFDLVKEEWHVFKVKTRTVNQ